VRLKPSSEIVFVKVSTALTLLFVVGYPAGKPLTINLSARIYWRVILPYFG